MKTSLGILAALALPLLAGSAAAAPLSGPDAAGAAPALRLAGFLPGVFGSRPDAPEIRLAQAGDPRVSQLEEQVRQLNGRIEELNFLILQMQDDVRKMQEDTEFRLQQLEDKRTDAGAAPSTGQAAAPASGGEDGKEAAARGEPPRDLGTLKVDPAGNPAAATAEAPRQVLPGAAPAGPRQDEPHSPDETIVAALPRTDDPDELYRNAYSFILSGDYPTAEAGFREHIERFPEDSQAADAHYWLGEALLGMQQYRSAAEVFLAANRDYPKSRKAPDMLLKLGVSLAALDQRDVACATYAEIGKRYKEASAALKERVKAEQALAGC